MIWRLFGRHRKATSGSWPCLESYLSPHNLYVQDTGLCFTKSLWPMFWLQNAKNIFNIWAHMKESFLSQVCGWGWMFVCTEWVSPLTHVFWYMGDECYRIPNTLKSATYLWPFSLSFHSHNPKSWTVPPYTSLQLIICAQVNDRPVHRNWSSLPALVNRI